MGINNKKSFDNIQIFLAFVLADWEFRIFLTQKV